MGSLQTLVFYISLPLSFVAFIFPIYASSLGVNVIEIGILYSVFSLASIVSRPFIGNLIDRQGRKVGLIIGIGLYIVAYFSFARAVNYNLLLVGRIIQSLGAAFFWITVNTMVSDLSTPSNIGEHFGAVGQLGARGQFIGSFVAFLILARTGLEDGFSAIFTLFVVSTIVGLVLTIRDVPETIEARRSIMTSKQAHKQEVTLFLLAMFTLSILSSLTSPIYLIYMQDNITRDLGLITLLFVPGAILASFLPRIFGKMADRYSKLSLIALGLSLTSVLQIFLGLSTGYTTYMVVYTLISISSMIASPALASLVIDYVGEDKRGRSYGYYSLATSGGTAIGPLIGSYFYANIGNDTVFYLKGLGMLVFILVFYSVYNRDRWGSYEENQ